MEPRFNPVVSLDSSTAYLGDGGSLLNKSSVLLLLFCIYFLNP